MARSGPPSKRVEPASVKDQERLERFRSDNKKEKKARKSLWAATRRTKGMSKKPFPLNIHESYCRRSNWNPAAGIRELIQNLYDGVLQSYGVTPDKIDVEEQSESQGQGVVLFRFFKKKTTAHCRRAGYGCLASIAFTPQGKLKPRSLSAVRDQCEDPTSKMPRRQAAKKHSELELINHGVQLSSDVLRMGNTTKTSDEIPVESYLIGSHGEGMKVGINALVRDGHGRQWAFTHSGDKELAVKITLAPLNSKKLYQHDADIDTHDISFDNFLFLRPPKDVLIPEHPACSGCVCLEPKYAHRLYEYRPTDLILGYDITKSLPLTRDRDIPRDEYELCEILWDHHDQTTRDFAAKRYLDFVELPTPPFETRYLKEFLESNQADKGEEFVTDICELLFTVFRENAKRGAKKQIWIYEDSAEGGAAIRIIEAMDRIPVKAPKVLYSIWEKYSRTTVWSAEVQRQRLLQSKADVDLTSSSSPSWRHTWRLINLFKELDSSLRNASHRWVNGENVDLDVVVHDSGRQVVLNSRNLDNAIFHTFHAPCIAFALWKAPVCDCAAKTLGGQIMDQKFEKGFKHVEAARQTWENLLATYPRQLVVTPSQEGVKLSWTTHPMPLDDFVIEVVKGTCSNNRRLHNVPREITPEPGSGAELALFQAQETTSNTTSDLEEMHGSDDILPSGPEKNLAGEQIPCKGTILEMPDIIPGIYYTAQVRADVSDWCTAWSAPLTVCRALDTVSDLTSVMEPDSFLRVSFSPVHCAQRYEITVHFRGIGNSKSIITNETSIKLSTCPQTPVQVEVVAISSDDIRSSAAAFMDVNSTITAKPISRAKSIQPHSPRNMEEVGYPSESSDAGEDDGSDDYLDDLGPPKPQNRAPSVENFQSVNEMRIHGHTFTSGRVFELVRRSHGSYDRVVFQVHAVFETISESPSVSSYVQGYMYRLSRDYAECRTFGPDPPSSALPCHWRDREVFLMEFDDKFDDNIHMVHLPVKEVTSVLKSVGHIHKTYHVTTAPQNLNDDDLWCSWTYSSTTSVGKGESFKPIFTSGVKPPLPSGLGVADIFCGAGGFSEGFRREGFEIVLGVDSNDRAADSFKINHPSANVHWTDVKSMLEEKEKENIALPPIHVALISPPCQGFSSANPGGKNDEGNRSLFSSVGDIAGAFEPLWICVENVPGLINQTNRKHLCALVFDLLSRRYAVKWAVQNAVNFGVPQIRKRVIIFAAQLGLTMPEFPAVTHTGSQQVNLSKSIMDLNHENPRADNDKGNPKYIAPILTEDSNSSTGTSMARPSHEIHYHATGYRRSAMSKAWPKAKWDEPSSTVRTTPGNRWKCVHPDGKRLLTVLELLRIQSFSADWHLSGPIPEQIKQVGNAVPPLLSAAWARAVRAAVLADYPELKELFKPTSFESSTGGRKLVDVEADGEVAEDTPRSAKRIRVQ
ncbi:hypothetical protein C8R43DRAFT_987452 [Mycena crocata]|nr:hypothetical protein C8R43DRAFT_987452 [Mycena crocata]